MKYKPCTGSDMSVKINFSIVVYLVLANYTF